MVRQKTLEGKVVVKREGRRLLRSRKVVGVGIGEAPGGCGECLVVLVGSDQEETVRRALSPRLRGKPITVVEVGALRPLFEPAPSGKEPVGSGTA